MRRLVIGVIMLTMVVAFNLSAQVTADATRATGIVVDGKLDEAVWAGATKNKMRHDIGTQLTDGSVDSESDLSTDFCLVWDDVGFYCGSWRTDDIHNTVWGNQPGVANKAWMDDGHEWYVSFDFNDVWEDASPPYYGQFGFQVWEGFFWENGAATDMYVSYRNDNGPTMATVAELQEQGFYAPYHSNDGINFTCEAQFKWSSFFLGSMSTPSAGKELGFNMSAQDNDGGEMGEGWLRWTGAAHSYQCWGKITLQDNVGIRPVRLSPIAISKTRMAGNAFDILGRRISVGRNAQSVQFYGSPTVRGQQARRAIILR